MASPRFLVSSIAPGATLPRVAPDGQFIDVPFVGTIQPVGTWDPSEIPRLGVQLSIGISPQIEFRRPAFTDRLPVGAGLTFAANVFARWRPGIAYALTIRAGVTFTVESTPFGTNYVELQTSVTLPSTVTTPAPGTGAGTGGGGTTPDPGTGTGGTGGTSTNATGLTFLQADYLIRSGAKIRRAGWPDRYLEYRRGLYFLQLLNPTTGVLGNRRVVSGSTTTPDVTEADLRAADWLAQDAVSEQLLAAARAISIVYP